VVSGQNTAVRPSYFQVVRDWSSTINRNSRTHAIFLDFSKAFDNVSHERLLLKLEHIGIRGCLLNWICSFLIGREQHVIIDDCSSDWITVTSGVPQGSILGPLLFIIHINDIGNSLTSSTKLFADDRVLYREISTIHDDECLQSDLSYMFVWSHTWQLNFNASKCKVMCITNKKSPLTYTYCLNNTPLEWISTFKYLRVTMNQKLTWHEHINNVTAKASRILNLLRCNLRHASKEAKARAHLALERTQLEYAAPVWTPDFKSQILKIENIQKRAARWVVDKWVLQTNSWSKTYDGCLNELRWHTLHGCRDLLSCCQMYKIIHNLTV